MLQEILRLCNIKLFTLDTVLSSWSVKIILYNTSQLILNIAFSMGRIFLEVKDLASPACK